jgi:hypothetical protein
MEPLERPLTNDQVQRAEEAVEFFELELDRSRTTYARENTAFVNFVSAVNAMAAVEPFPLVPTEAMLTEKNQWTTAHNNYVDTQNDLQAARLEAARGGADAAAALKRAEAHFKVVSDTFARASARLIDAVRFGGNPAFAARYELLKGYNDSAEARLQTETAALEETMREVRAHRRRLMQEAAQASRADFQAQLKAERAQTKPFFGLLGGEAGGAKRKRTRSRSSRSKTHARSAVGRKHTKATKASTKKSTKAC